MNYVSLVKTIHGDIDLLLNMLTTLQQNNEEAINLLRRAGIEDPILPLRYAFESMGEAIDKFAKEADSELALTTISQLLSAAGQVDAILPRLSFIEQTYESVNPTVLQAAQSISGAWSALIQQIQSILKSISSAIWSFVSKYLNLKEWSIKGTISTPAITSLFGISGSAEIQFTFEK